MPGIILEGNEAVESREKERRGEGVGIGVYGLGGPGQSLWQSSARFFGG